MSSNWKRFVTVETYPLFAVVGLGIGLAAGICVYNVAKSDENTLNKNKPWQFVNQDPSNLSKFRRQLRAHATQEDAQ